MFEYNCIRSDKGSLESAYIQGLSYIHILKGVLPYHPDYDSQSFFVRKNACLVNLIRVEGCMNDVVLLMDAMTDCDSMIGAEEKRKEEEKERKKEKMKAKEKRKREEEERLRKVAEKEEEIKRKVEEEKRKLMREEGQRRDLAIAVALQRQEIEDAELKREASEAAAQAAAMKAAAMKAAAVTTTVTAAARTETDSTSSCCSICLEHAASVACVPCGHLCGCRESDCLQGMLSAGRSRCPICNAEVASLLRVFNS
jgi:actin-related protein